MKHIVCQNGGRFFFICIALKDTLGKYAYANFTEDSFLYLLIEIFHKCTYNSSKDRILQKFSQLNSTICCIVATVAVGRR